MSKANQGRNVASGTGKPGVAIQRQDLGSLFGWLIGWFVWRALWESVSFFYHVGPRGQMQVIRLNRQAPYLLSQLAKPNPRYFWKQVNYHLPSLR